MKIANFILHYLYCPSCGNKISEYENNKPVADFYCSMCQEDYELKSKKDNIGKKIVDGAYSTMIQRLQSDSNPNFFFLNYDKNNLNVTNFIVIPKHFFIPEIIEKKKTLIFFSKASWLGWL
jgi:type II restriction enzyme